jgi:xylulose-5-phosphate/fructose-6-phosphate phosphoketolase
MVMMNDLDRFHLVMDVIDRVPGLASSAGHVRQLMVDKRIEARAYTREHGEDAPEINDWKWRIDLSASPGGRLTPRHAR